MHAPFQRKRAEKLSHAIFHALRTIKSRHFANVCFLRKISIKLFNKGNFCMIKGGRSIPTMKDVAREAGVALGTVSKVFNDIPVGEDYRQRVIEASEKLGYQVNQYARGLKTNKTYTVALILPGMDHPFFALLAQHVCLALEKRGYRTLLYLTGSSPEVEQNCIRMVRQNKADGIIGLTYNPNLEIDEDIPFVSIDRYFSPSVPCVTSDNLGGGQMAAEKLISLGCRHLAFLRIGAIQTGEVDKRGDGFEQVCRAQSICCDLIRMNENDSEIEDFFPLLQSHISDGRLDWDGIFCATDELAWHIQDMLGRLNIRVPEDVQIIGFDGVPVQISGKLPCSTIVQPIAQIAEASVDFLLHEDKSSLPSMLCLPVKYSEGGTTREG